MTVLLVEDDALALDVLGEILAQAGHAVHRTDNGFGALTWLRVTSHLPQVILLDLMMPGMDGYTFLRELRGHAAWQDIPVIVQTALSEGDIMKLDPAFKPFTVLRKPYEVAELLRIIEEMATCR